MPQSNVNASSRSTNWPERSAESGPAPRLLLHRPGARVGVTSRKAGVVRAASAVLAGRAFRHRGRQPGQGADPVTRRGRPAVVPAFGVPIVRSTGGVACGVHDGAPREVPGRAIGTRRRTVGSPVAGAGHEPGGPQRAPCFPRWSAPQRHGGLLIAVDDRRRSKPGSVHVWVLRVAGRRGPARLRWRARWSGCPGWRPGRRWRAHRPAAVSAPVPAGRDRVPRRGGRGPVSR